MFKQTEEVPTQEKSENPTFDLIQPTPGVTLEGYGSDAAKGEKPEGISQDEERVLSDARTFSSSPRATSILLSPVATQSPRGVNFGLTTSIDHPLRLQTVRGQSLLQLLS
jgi:hypothetical protein